MGASVRVKKRGLSQTRQVRNCLSALRALICYRRGDQKAVNQPFTSLRALQVDVAKEIGEQSVSAISLRAIH